MRDQRATTVDHDARDEALRDAAGVLVGSIDRFRLVALRLGRRVEEVTGVGTAQAMALLAIEAGARRVRDLAEETMVHPSAASRMVETLVDEGSATRDVDPTDRRNVVIQLTSRGKEKTQAIRAAYLDAVEEILKAMPREQAVVFAELFDAYLATATTVLREDLPGEPDA